MIQKRWLIYFETWHVSKLLYFAILQPIRWNFFRWNSSMPSSLRWIFRKIHYAWIQSSFHWTLIYNRIPSWSRVFSFAFETVLGIFPFSWRYPQIVSSPRISAYPDQTFTSFCWTRQIMVPTIQFFWGPKRPTSILLFPTEYFAADYKYETKTNQSKGD